MLTMFKLASLIFLLGLANSQYNSDIQTKMKTSSPAKILLPKIVEVIQNFGRTLEKEMRNVQKMSTIERVMKNCWLLRKLPHRTGGYFSRQCLKNTFGWRKAKLTNENDPLLDLKLSKEKQREQKQWKTGLSPKQNVLRLYKLEEMFKSFSRLLYHDKRLTRRIYKEKSFPVALTVF